MERAEKIGLGVATAGHVLLFALLSGSFFAPNPLKLNSPPIAVDLVDDVALESTAPKVSLAPPPPSTAPEIGPEERAEPAPAPEPAPEPEPQPKPEPPKPAPPPPKPAPAPKPVERAKPKPPKPAPPKPSPKPAARPTPSVPAPAAKPTPRPTPRPAAPAAKPSAKPAPRAAAPAKPAAKPTGSRNRSLALSDDIEAGARTERSNRPTSNAPPAATMGPQQKAALDAEIRRQLKQHWRPPSGADADQLVTLLSVRLDRDGNVIGQPEVVDQSGITDSNRPQAALHAERAVQAVMRASPFQNLPPEFYNQWKWLKPLRFDARLLR